MFIPVGSSSLLAGSLLVSVSGLLGSGVLAGSGSGSKLACWVHEQRKKFVKSVLLEDRLVLLLDNGFIFQPRLHEKESMKTLVDRHKGMYCSTFVCL